MSDPTPRSDFLAAVVVTCKHLHYLEVEKHAQNRITKSQSLTSNLGNERDGAQDTDLPESTEYLGHLNLRRMKMEDAAQGIE